MNKIKFYHSTELNCENSLVKAEDIIKSFDSTKECNDINYTN